MYHCHKEASNNLTPSFFRVGSARAYLSNGYVAWEIPGGRIAYMFLIGAYIPPPGWTVQEEPDDSWYTGQCGELRRESEDPVCVNN